MFGMIGAFDPAFYSKVAYQRVSRSIGFLAVFVLIISCALSVKYTGVLLKALGAVRQWADKDFISLTAEFPEVQIKDGLLVKPQQTYVKEFQRGFCFAIEPDAQKGAKLLEGYGTVILLTERRLIVKNTKSPGTTEQKVYDLAQVKYLQAAPTPSGVSFAWEQNTIEVTPAAIDQWIAALSVFVFPAVLLFFFRGI